MKRFTIPLLAMAALVAAAVPAAFADGFIFTDDRCRPEVKQAICIARAEETTIENFIRGRITFKKFVEYNATALPEDVTPQTVLPARTVYILKL